MKTARIEVELYVDATPERVFAALFDTEALRAWFAESAEVSAAERHYHFWGRYTPEDPSRADGRHPIRDLKMDRLLTYDWRLRGADTRVSISLVPEGSGTQIQLRHDDAPARRVEEGSLADWWGLSLENLEAWLTRRRAGLRVDFATPPELEIRLVAGIKAPRYEVFRALTDPDQLTRWIAEPGKVVIEPHAGGRLDFGWGEEGGPVRIVSIEPDREIAYSWKYPGEPETTVTWSLIDSGAGTDLTLMHLGFVDAVLDRPHRTGWTKFVNRLKHLVEAGPDWRMARTVAHDYEAAR